MLVALVTFHGALRASTILYSNFGLSDSFVTGSGAVITNAGSLTPDLRPSFELPVIGSNQLLSEVDFVTSIESTSDLNQVTVSLFGDAAGHPGNLIASHQFDGAMGVLGETDFPPVTLSWNPALDQAGAPALTSGNLYWITLDAPAGSNVTWNFNNTGQSGYLVFQSGRWQATNQTLGALQVLAVPNSGAPVVPEPGTLSLLFAGLAGGILFSRRRRARSLR